MMVGAAALACAPLAGAAYPDRPIKLVVPYTPGGSTDQFGRALAEGMSRELKQSVVVENKPGAATMIGTNAVARAPADGYTVVFATNGSMVLNPMLYKKITYDPPRDFKIFSIGAEVPLVVVTNTQVPATNIREFAAYAKSADGKLNYASVGLGNALQLATEMLKSELGIKVTHVPYNGSAPAHQGRKAQAARGDFAQAAGRAAQRADRGGKRLPGLPGRDVVRTGRAGRDAARGGRPPACRRRSDRARSQVPRDLRRARAGGATAAQPGRDRPLYRG
jgi:tripartite-type tricarboxylate transporter receptor subunit TctC